MRLTSASIRLRFASGSSSVPPNTDGQHAMTLRGTYDELAAEFQQLVDTYVETRYSARTIA